MTKKIFISFFFFSFFFLGCLLAFDNFVIHPSLTEASINAYNSQAQEKISKEQAALMIYGSIFEDTDPRYLNHYYDPSTGRGLNSGIFRGQPAKEWAKKQNSVSGDYSESAIFNNYRNGNYKRAYQGIGHVLHLVQDMAVPAHTRNDEHAVGDPFEAWAKKYGRVDFGNNNLVQIQNLDQAFDELASFSHYNFFSKDTVFIINNYEKALKEIDGKKREYLINELGGHKYIIAFSKSPDWIVSAYQVDGDYFLFNDYWKMLHPKAVAYGAGVIDHFMREFKKIDEEEGRNKSSWWQAIKNKISGVFEELRYFRGDILIATSFTAHNIGEAFKAFFDNEEDLQEFIADLPFEEFVAPPVIEASESSGSQDTNDEPEEPKEPVKPAKEFVQISRVIDGDTIELVGGERVRYLGIDAPELGQPGPEDDECLAWVARLRNMDLLARGSVRLEKDSAVDKDVFGNSLRYVYAGDVFLNKVMVNEGLAKEFFCPKNNPGCHSSGDQVRRNEIVQAFQNAQVFKRGLFSGACSTKEEKAVLGEKIIKPESDSDNSILPPEDTEAESNNNFVPIHGGPTQDQVSDENPSSNEEDEIDTSIIEMPFAFSSSTSAYFVFSSNVSEATFEYSFNGDDWLLVGSELFLENIADGQHNLKVRAVQSEQKDETPAEYSWIVDTLAPEIEMLKAEECFEKSGWEVIWQGNDLTEQFEDEFLKYDVRYRLDENDWQDWLFLTASTSALFSEEAVFQEICFSARAIDYAGNQSDWSEPLCGLAKEMPQIKDFKISGSASNNQSTTYSNVRLNYEIVNPHLIFGYLASDNFISPSPDNERWSNDAVYSFDLEEGDGEKWIYFFIKTEEGIVLTASSSIILDTTPPVAPEITNIAPEPGSDCSDYEDVYWINSNPFIIEGKKELGVDQIVINRIPYDVDPLEETWSIEYFFNLRSSGEMAFNQGSGKNSVSLCAVMILCFDTETLSFQVRDEAINFSNPVFKVFAFDTSAPSIKNIVVQKSIPRNYFHIITDVGKSIFSSFPKEYILEVNDNFGNLSITRADIDRGNDLYGFVEQAGEYFARVRLVNWAGNYSEWSDIVSFQTDFYPVISEIYGGGGNTGATWKNDFVELYNPTSADISLDGWSLQYASASGAFQYRTTLSGTIRSGGYYLIKAGSGSSGDGLDLENWDATASFNLSASAGKIALSRASDTISGINDSNVADFVGYGGASEFEGNEPAPSMGNMASLERLAFYNSCVCEMEPGGDHEFSGNGWDTNNNKADFDLRDLPQPQGTWSDLEDLTF